MRMRTLLQALTLSTCLALRGDVGISVHDDYCLPVSIKTQKEIGTILSDLQNDKGCLQFFFDGEYHLFEYSQDGVHNSADSDDNPLHLSIQKVTGNIRKILLQKIPNLSLEKDPNDLDLYILLPSDNTIQQMQNLNILVYDTWLKAIIESYVIRKEILLEGGVEDDSDSSPVVI